MFLVIDHLIRTCFFRLHVWLWLDIAPQAMPSPLKGSQSFPPKMPAAEVKVNFRWLKHGLLGNPLQMEALMGNNTKLVQGCSDVNLRWRSNMIISN